MKHFVLYLFVATSVTCLAQTSSKPAAPRIAAKSASTSSTAKLPPGVPVVHGIVKAAFSLRYEDIKIGTGKEAEANKVYKVRYTGWLAATGRKFDSSYDRKTPVIGIDGKPEVDADGKTKVQVGEPIAFMQGIGRVIPGFDNGFEGMKVGGKRRLFIPWQLAYGARGRLGPSPENPGIPAKADLIFDIELVDMTDVQMPPAHPGMGSAPNGQPMHVIPHPPIPGTPGTQPPAGTTPPAGTPTTPPSDKPQSN
ncbi:MAG TPA: FKBP-type peptidyl-prolyl cis-trans isomerase [Terracidiphilus sp.]|jgi:peptidylprolyl isomerase